MGIGSDQRSYVISANWDPTDPSTKILNTETPKGMNTYTQQFMPASIQVLFHADIKTQSASGRAGWNVLPTKLCVPTFY